MMFSKLGVLHVFSVSGIFNWQGVYWDIPHHLSQGIPVQLDFSEQGKVGGGAGKEVRL